MKSDTKKLQVAGKDSKFGDAQSNTQMLQRRSTSDEVYEKFKLDQTMVPTPFLSLQAEIEKIKRLKILESSVYFEYDMFKKKFEVYLTYILSLKTGLFTNAENFRGQSLKDIFGGFLLDEITKKYVAFLVNIPRIHIYQIFSSTPSMRQRLRQKNASSRMYGEIIWDQVPSNNLVEKFISILQKLELLLDVTQKLQEDQHFDSDTISAQINMGIMGNLFILSIFLTYGFVKADQGIRILSICKQITKKFLGNDVQMVPQICLVLIQVLIHVEVLIQDQLLFPIGEQGDKIELPEVAELYDSLLFTSHIALSVFQKSNIDYNSEEFDFERYSYYMSIFHNLVLNRESTKIAKVILQVHPILILHSNSDFSELAVVSTVVEELRSMLNILTRYSYIDIELKKFVIDEAFCESRVSDFLIDLDEFKKEELEQIWKIFEQRLEYLAQTIDSSVQSNEIDAYSKLRVFLAEKQIMPMMLKLICVLSKSQGMLGESFVEKCKSLVSTCFKIMIGTGKNNPCAIEQLLMSYELKFLTEIVENYPIESWFWLYSIFAPSTGQDEIFTMNNNQMMLLGQTLIGLLDSLKHDPRQDDPLLFDEALTCHFFAASALYEFINKVEDNIRTQQDKIQMLKDKNPDDKLEGFEVDALGLMQLKLKIVQATEKLTEMIMKLYLNKASDLSELLELEDNSHQLKWYQIVPKKHPLAKEQKWVIHHIRGIKKFDDFKNFRKWRKLVCDYFSQLENGGGRGDVDAQAEDDVEGDAEAQDNHDKRVCNIFFGKEILDLLGMTIHKCQEARNLVRKTPSIELDSDQKIQRNDEYLDVDLNELKEIIDVYNRCNIKNRHHEILWQIIKSIHRRLDFDDPSRSWVKIVGMVMERFNIFDDEGRRMTWRMDQEELRRKKAHMLRYVDEVLMNLLFVVLHSGRGFFDLETRKMSLNFNKGLQVFTFEIIQEMLDAVKKAVGGIMKFDPTKLKLDGKIFDPDEEEKKVKEEQEKLEKDLQIKREAKLEEKQKKKDNMTADGRAEQSIEEIEIKEDDNDEEENMEDDDAEEKAKKKLKENAQFNMVIEMLSILNKYHDDDAIFSQKLWLQEKMLEVQESWIKFLLKSKRGVSMRRENLKKPFKELYRGGDSPLVYDLPDDLLGEFGPEFSMMNTTQDMKQFYQQVDMKNILVLAKKTQQFSQAIQFMNSIQAMFEQYRQIFFPNIVSTSDLSSATDSNSFKDYYRRYPEHIYLLIKYQLQCINFFTKHEKYVEYYSPLDYIYKIGESIALPVMINPMKYSVYILSQMLEHHITESQILIFMLCCHDKDLSTGKVIEQTDEALKTKTSLKSLTLALYADKLSMLTDSNLKYTMYLKKRKKEREENQYSGNDEEEISRENYWMKLANLDEDCANAFWYLSDYSTICRISAMYNQTIMISSLDKFAQLKLAEYTEINKFSRNLCENNCLFFKDQFFHWAVKRDSQAPTTKYSTYLIDLLMEFMLFFNKDKRFLGYWAGKSDQMIYRHKLFERNMTLINFTKHNLYLIYEIMDGLITNHSVESQLNFDEFLEKLISNEVYMGIVEIVDFLFKIDFKKQTKFKEVKYQIQGDQEINQDSSNTNKVSDAALDHAKKVPRITKSETSNMIEFLDHEEGEGLNTENQDLSSTHTTAVFENGDKLEQELLGEINKIRQGLLRLITLPLKNKMTKNSFFAENIITLIDFESVLNTDVAALVKFINKFIYRTSKTNLITDDDFLTLYKGNKTFRECDLLKECGLIIHLILALSDAKLTLEKKRKIIGIVAVLRKYGLKSPDDRFSDAQEDCDCLGEVLTRQTKEYLQFIAKVIQRVEIVVPQNEMISTDRENKIILFDNPPQTFFLQDEKRDEYMEMIDQENPRQDLMKYSGVLLLDMDKNFEFYQKGSLRYYFLQDNSVTFQKQILWCFSLLINIVCLVTYKLSEVDGQNDRDQRRLESENWKWVVNIASFALAGYSLILLIMWLGFKMPIHFDIAREFYLLNSGSLRGKELGFWVKAAIVYHTFSYESAMINMIFHAIFGILGPLLDPFFHALHLLLFVNISSSAMYIVKASTNRLGLLVNTLFMAVFLIFAYSILTANYYSDKFGDLDDKNIDACATLASCFLYSFSIGLQSPLGDKMTPYDYQTETKFGLKLVFDITFFIFINTIILNMVFGIITDAFGEMRDKSYERKENIENTCLICQNKRGNIEEANVNFKNHIHTDHAYFLYVNFIKYMREKDPRNFTADEVSVFKDIEAGKVDWMPLSKSLYLEGMEEDEDLLKERLYDQVAIIEKGVKTVNEKLDKIITKMEYKQS